MILEAVARFAEERGLESVEFAYHPSRTKLDTVKVLRGGRPVTVLKVGRSADRVRRVHGKLAAVARALEDTPLQGSTPAPLLLSAEGEGEAKFLAESVLPGTPGEKLVQGPGHRRRTRRLLGKVVGWLVAFQAAFPDDGGEHGEGGAPTSGAGRIDGERWRAGPMHGDFVTQNVLVDGNGLRVIDWDEFRVRGSPPVDLLYFLVDVARKHSPEPFQFAFYGDTWYSRLAGEAADRYCQGTGMERSELLDHVPLYLEVSRAAASAQGNDGWRRELEAAAADFRPQRVVWR